MIELSPINILNVSFASFKSDKDNIIEEIIKPNRNKIKTMREKSLMFLQA